MIVTVIEKGASWALARLAAGRDTPPNGAVPHELGGYLAVRSPLYFELSLLAVNYGLGDNGPLKDSSGRDIQMTEGVILTQGRRGSARLGISAADLARARHDVAAVSAC